MQNKGFVKLIAVCLAVICCLYLAITVKSRNFKATVDEIAATKGYAAAEEYQDTILDSEKDGFLWMNMRSVREMGLSFGLDLEGGMNVILEVGVPDVLKALSDHREATDSAFAQAIAVAEESAKTGGDVVSDFISKYQDLKGKDQLGRVFSSTESLGSKVKSNQSDAEVKKVLEEEVNSSIENAFNILRNRIDQFGVAQPNIQRLEGQKGRIMVELPGVKEPERVRNLLQGSANLEFWECWLANEIQQKGLFRQIDQACQKEAALAQYDEAAAPVEEAAPAEEVADTLATEEVAEQSITEALASEKAAEPAKTAACVTLTSLLDQTGRGIGSSVVASAPKFRMAAIDSLLALPAVQEVLKANNVALRWSVKNVTTLVNENGKTVEKKTNLVGIHALKVSTENGRANMEGDVVASARESYDQKGHPCVSMTMTTEGARDWATLTRKNVQRPIAIVLDDKVYSAPNVMNEITGGNSEITGNFTPEDTRDLVNVLKSGRMSAPAHIVSEEIVGPSLGAESINQGLWSCIIAFVILMIYMITMYGFTAGMVANCALILNLFFTIGILNSFQAALTMSGIAGMVLSLGMAVDANVLIYERTKEELRAGKRTREALAAGYSNAFSAIFDSNITSIITGIILFYFGTGPIRGFATTLIIGICISFFTAVFLTRVVYETVMAKDKWLDLTFTTPAAQKFFQNPSYDFMGMAKKSFIVFGAIVVVCAAFMLGRGFSKSIDFTGGRNYVVVFDNEVKPEQAREVLGAAFEGSNTSVIALGTDGKTIRITTNYRINEEGVEVDGEIENKLFEALQSAKMVAAEVTAEEFKNPDNRAGGSIISSQKVGPSIAEDITRGAIISVLLAFVAIFIYILVRFRDFAFSVGAITALFCDIMFILGMYAICWGILPMSLEIDQTFIGAILTAIGYSINDKVVVFDRIREFIGLHPKADRHGLINQSLNSTLTRTINTSVSTFIVLAVIFVLGGNSIRSFAFAMILGVIFGTLSSIFVAAPTAYAIMRKKMAKAEK